MSFELGSELVRFHLRQRTPSVEDGLARDGGALSRMEVNGWI